MKRQLRMRLCLALLALPFVTCFAVPAVAQDQAVPLVVRATDASGLLAVLKQAGFKAKIEPRDKESGSTSIEISTRDGAIYVHFSDCEGAVPDFCETLVLSSSWNRTTPIPDAVIAEANRNYKYVSIWRDEEGDPVVQWAILTGDVGIASPLFLNALQRYLDIVRDFDEIAFDGDEGSDKPADVQPAT